MDYSKWDQNKSAGKIIVIVLIYSLCTAIALFIGVIAWPNMHKPASSQLIGFDYSNKVPEQTSGDTAAASHIFIHNYPFPSDGWLTGITYLNDSEMGNIEQQEEIFILVLRPENRIFRIVYRQEIMMDDLLQEVSGVTRVVFPQPLKVKKGDLLAHWQPTNQTGGPIPLNLDEDAGLGFTSGKASFQFEDTSAGKTIDPEGFSGCRNYFLQAIFQPEKD